MTCNCKLISYVLLSMGVFCLINEAWLPGAAGLAAGLYTLNATNHD